MQMKKLATMVAMATMAMGSQACSDVECENHSDCAFSQMCSDGGQCVVANPVSVNGDGGAVLDNMAGAGAFAGNGGGSSAFQATGVFDGTIGGAAVDVAEVAGSTLDSNVFISLTAAGRRSTFLLFQVPADAFTEGSTTWRSDWSSSYAQACNYDTTSYDESFPEFEVEVSPPRAAEPDDQIIAEDAPTEVVDVVISVNGDGSDVVGTFAMPVVL